MAADVAETIWYNEDSASPLTVSKPAAFASGQVLVAVIHQHGPTGHVTDMTAPTGWTQVTGDMAGTNSQGRVFYLVFTAGLPSTWDFPYYTNADTCLALLRITGADTAPTISLTTANSTSVGASFDSPTITPSGADDLLICTIGDIADGNTFSVTVPSGMAATSPASTQIAGGFMALAAATQQLSTGSATGAKTWTTVSPAGHDGGTFSIVIKSAAAATAVPYAAPRYPATRDPGEAWWLQRGRRDTALVAAAANDLAAPLLVPTDTRVWHTTARDRRSAFQQRAYVSDPSLLAPDVYPLGSADDLRRRQQTAASNAPRTWAPQQRPLRSEPTMLSTAQLEDALLGSADTARHHAAATHASRRLAPQQRPYVSDPGLLLTALLESPLLVGTRPNGTVDDRRIMPMQQRLASVDLLTPAEGVPTGQDRRYGQAATHAERRQVTQQQPRQTAYFDAGPGDPILTIAWGVGGTYWHTYHRSAAAYMGPRSWLTRPVQTVQASSATGLTGNVHGPLPQVPGSATPPLTAGLPGAIT